MLGRWRWQCLSITASRSCIPHPPRTPAPHCSHNRLPTTQAVTAAVLIAASDLLAQRLTSAAPTNWRRTLSMALYGFLWAGPSSHFWQHILENMFPDKSDALRRWARVWACRGPARARALPLSVDCSLAARGARWRRTRCASMHVGAPWQTHCLV